MSAMEETVQLVGDLAAAKSNAAAAAAGDNSGDGEIDYHHHNDDSDYPPRNFKKYRSIVEIYQSTEPSEIVNTTAKRRQGENKRMMKEKAANVEEEEEEGNKAVELSGNSNFIEVESLEEAKMETCPTRNPITKYRSILELYEVTLQPATVSVMHIN